MSLNYPTIDPFKEKPSEKIKKFLNALEKVCEKHGFSLGHEDGHGGFIVEVYHTDNIDWMKAASPTIEANKK